MANDEHVALLKKGVAAWNAWRAKNPDIRPDLFGANLSRANLGGANLNGAILLEAKLVGANLVGAYLGGTTLVGADLVRANLSSANLVGADLFAANFGGANLSRANLSGASLFGATLVDADLTGADLTGCRIYGVSAWGLKLEGVKQQNLVITKEDEPTVTVDNIEVAQFIYLLLHNPKIRDVIDTIGRKAVLILGRFTPERKAVLDALREELRKRDYVPILFDFDKPASQDLTATVSTLAHLARFIIADLTDPSSIPYELATVVPTTPVPIQPILLSGSSEFAMFQDLRRRHHWVLTTHRYDSQKQLIADLGEKVIRPAELKVLDLQGST
jgi:Pentapeptide repeats (8 copies)